MYDVVRRRALNCTLHWCRGFPYHGTIFSDHPLHVFGDRFQVAHKLSLSKVVINNFDGVSASKGVAVAKAVFCLKQIQQHIQT